MTDRETHTFFTERSVGNGQKKEQSSGKRNRGNRRKKYPRVFKDVDGTQCVWQSGSQNQGSYECTQPIPQTMFSPVRGDLHSNRIDPSQADTCKETADKAKCK